MRYTSIYLVILFFTCNRSNYRKSPKIQNPIKTLTENKIRIFRMNEYYKSFTLTINDTYFYSDSTRKSLDDGAGTFIGEVVRNKQDSFKIHLRINMHDTLFFYNTKEVDSILFGLGGNNNRNFYILTNQQRAAWLFE